MQGHVIEIDISFQFKDKVVSVLNFTALLIEHSYARHIYNSTEVGRGEEEVGGGMRVDGE